MNETYKETGCADLGLNCQCGKCGNYKYLCCMDRVIRCPNDPDYDPSYVCPDFTPREEDANNATQ